MSKKIHSTAIVDAKAKIADDVEIGPNCIIGSDVTIKEGCRFIANCYVTGHTRIGKNNVFHPNSCIGTNPQDYKYNSEISYLEIGDNNIFRESTTVNVGTEKDSATCIGNNGFFMANTHIAHNCKIGNNVIMVNSAIAGGYVQLGDNCFMSGVTAVHQFCRVGRLALISGASAISLDLPPFMITSGRNGPVQGINLVGMRRNNFSKETIRALKNLYKIYSKSKENIKNTIKKIKAEVPLVPEVVEFCDFVESSKRGVLKGINQVSQLSSVRSGIARETKE